MCVWVMLRIELLHLSLTSGNSDFPTYTYAEEYMYQISLYIRIYKLMALLGISVSCNTHVGWSFTIPC